jgi:hypothetical protein
MLASAAPGPVRLEDTTMSDFVTRTARRTLAAALLLTLAACGGGSGGGSTGSSTGVLKLGITDSPVDGAEAVVVQFTGVELKPREGAPFSIDFTSNGAPAPRTVDLLTLQGGKRAMLLDGATVPAGEYEWMRLKVTPDPTATLSYVKMAGQQCEMRIPSGAETGLKLVRGFTVGVGTTTDMTVDFDVRKSLVAPPGQRSSLQQCTQGYLLKPVLRVADMLEVGSVAGRVDAALMANRACAAPESTHAGVVHLFGPYGTEPAPVPDDLDGIATDGADALATANVDKATFQYTIGFVPKGRYVVAYTCDRDDAAVDADTDQAATPPPAVDELVNFEPAAGRPIEVIAGQATQADFAPAP